MLAWRGCQTPQTHQGKPVVSWMAAIAQLHALPGQPGILPGCSQRICFCSAGRGDNF